MNDLCNEKIFKNEQSEDSRRYKDFLLSQIRRTNNVQMAILPKPSYRLNVIPMKIPMIFSTETNNKKCKRPQIAKSAMKKKE